ncbi:hypothetical protein CL614_04805 [archaeon]|nr:hypothetical protein [archaeon]
MNTDEEMPSTPVYTSNESLPDFNQFDMPTVPKLSLEPSPEPANFKSLTDIFDDIQKSLPQPKQIQPTIQESIKPIVKQEDKQDNIDRLLQRFIQPKEKKKTCKQTIMLGVITALTGISAALFVKYVFDTINTLSGPPVLGVLVSFMLLLLFVMLFNNQFNISKKC